MAAATAGGKPTWTNVGLYDYGVWMGSAEFADGLRALEVVVDSTEGRCAIMCAEVLWWKCHRSMIADAWEAFGGEAFHIWPQRAPSRHLIGNRLARYEAETQQLWRQR